MQTKAGKAFEYACLETFYSLLSENQRVEKEISDPFLAAQEFYRTLGEDLSHKMDLAARAAAKSIIRLEPQLVYPNSNVPLILSIQADSKGIAGDVRDILCIRRQNHWEIGFSCKHNHFAVKHSRLSYTIDFGARWFGKPCSSQYFNEIAPLFCKLTALKAKQAFWRDLEQKEERFYIPVLNAFIHELLRLNDKYISEIPPALITYLLGRNDFYKIIARDSNKTTEIQAYNLFGTLNQVAGTQKPGARIPQVKLPEKIFDISYKKNSRNTIIITCDGGWAVSLRIHNASSKVEPSLKFDVNLIGTPNLGSIVEPWEEQSI